MVKKFVAIKKIIIFLVIIVGFSFLVSCQEKNVPHEIDQQQAEIICESCELTPEAVSTLNRVIPENIYPSAGDSSSITSNEPYRSGNLFPLENNYQGESYPTISDDVNKIPYPEMDDPEVVYPLPVVEDVNDANPLSPGALLDDTPVEAMKTPWVVDRSIRASNPDSFEPISGKIQLVEFFAFWCGTCQAMAPILNELEAEYGQQMNFVYLDIDDPANQDHKSILKYRYQPHFLLLDEKGNILRQWVGFITKNHLRQEIESAIPD